jgi:hypothetical protein
VPIGIILDYDAPLGEPIDLPLRPPRERESNDILDPRCKSATPKDISSEGIIALTVSAPFVPSGAAGTPLIAPVRIAANSEGNTASTATALFVIDRQDSMP